MTDIFQDYSFGGFFRKFRIENNFTLRSAANELGMDPGNLSRLERSELYPPRNAKIIEEYGNKLLFTPEKIDLLQGLAYSSHIEILNKEFWG